MKYGTEYENVARKSIESVLNIEIKRCGLLIDSEILFFDASLDGLIHDDGIVEIKCPYAARFSTPEDMITANISNLQSLYKNANDEKMKCNHVYYQETR